MMKSRHVKTGYKGELKIADILKAQGYEVTVPDDSFSGDLLVYCPIEKRQYKIEVKSSNRGKRGSFNFCLYREGKTDVRHADVLALVFYDEKTVEIRFIDAFMVHGLKNLCFRSMPSIYNGKWSKQWHKELASVSVW